jgi:hypothetical protein
MNKKCKVTATKLNIREQPDLTGAIIGTLDKDEIVAVNGTSEDGDWYQIIRSDNLTGWSSRKYLEDLESAGKLLTGRCIYIWKLAPVIEKEGGVSNFINKAKKAKFSSIWIKVAEGQKRYPNITGEMKDTFQSVVQKLKDQGIAVWGWHVPYCPTHQDAQAEALLLDKIVKEFSLDGLLMDAEAGSGFFQGNAQTAETYAKQLRNLLEVQGKGLAISSHDIPTNFPDFPFNVFAKYAIVNAPQVYYGGSSSVESRLNHAIQANHHLAIPFVPVGAGWIGEGGGCSSASACAQRAVQFMKLVREKGFPGYSFWHWGGAPAEFWNILFTEGI